MKKRAAPRQQAVLDYLADGGWQQLGATDERIAYKLWQKGLLERRYLMHPGGFVFQYRLTPGAGTDHAGVDVDLVIDDDLIERARTGRGPKL